MKPITLAFFGMLVVLTTAQADDLRPMTCGDSAIAVSPAKVKGGQKLIQDFLVTVTKSTDSRTFQFSAKNDQLALRCEMSIDGRKLLLVRHICGGSGCAENNFSIIELRTFNKLLNADSRWKGNQTAAETVVGRKVKPFSCGKFQDEYCYHTKFE